MAAARSPLQDLCEELTCAICLDYFQDPVTIAECGHNFCQACLAQNWEEEEGYSLVVSCPQCRETAQQRNLILNRQLKNVVEITKKLSLQDQGKDQGVDRICQKHQVPLKLFCKDHKAPICMVCNRSKEHEGHKVVQQEEACQEYKEQICTRVKFLRAEKENILLCKTDIEKKSQELLNQTEEERQKTMAEFQQIYQFLEEQEKSLLAQIEEVEKEIARRRDEHLAKLCRELSSLEKLIQEMEEKWQQPASEFLQDVRKTLKRSKKKKAFENPVAFPPELTCRIRQLSFRKPQLAGAMNQFKASAANVTLYARSEKMEVTENPVPFPPKLVSSIRDFSDRKPLLEGLSHQFNANVTLDPDTAHPKLILSEDLKSVRWGDRRQALPNNPERFDFWPFVLGSEGFTAGRQFWEVTVGREGTWAVGVARKSVRRKGWFDLSPEEGIWAVEKWSGQYRVCNSPYSTPLTLSQELKRIRVTLNCEEGQVSFSDADTGVHLYTHSGASLQRETIFPFFHLVGEAYLRLTP